MLFRSTRELVSVNYSEPARSPLSSPSGEALDYASYFAELLDEWAQEADADDRLYRLGTSMLDALGAGAPVEPLARYFEYWLLRLQGVYRADPGASSEALAFLDAARSCSPFGLVTIPASPGVLRELERAHRAQVDEAVLDTPDGLLWSRRYLQHWPVFSRQNGHADVPFRVART